MQLANLIAILSPSAASTAHTAVTDSDVGTPSQQFAQLLGDSQAKNTASDNGKQPTDSTHDLALRSAVALIAQEVPTASADDAQRLADRLTQPITKEQASAALDTLQAQASSDESPTDAFTPQLKAALTAIKNGEGKETIASLLAKLPATASNTQVPLAAQLLQLIKPVATVATDADVAEAAVQKNREDQKLSALMQSLEASLFRTPDGQSQTVRDDTPKPQEPTTHDITEIVPLSAALLVAAPVPVVQTATTQGLVSPRADLDTAIPPLTLPIADKPVAENDLPEVQLPAAVPANDNEAASAPANDHFAKILDMMEKANGNHTAALTDEAAAQLAAPLTSPKDTKPAVQAVVANEPVANTNNNALSANAVAPVSTTDTKTTAQSMTVAIANAQGVSTKTVEEKIVDTKIDDTASTTTPAVTAAPTHEIKHAQAPITIAPAVIAQPVVEQVHVAISHAVKDGTNQVTIQLDPAELGRVEVRMHTGSDGQTQIAFLVDKPSTLDSLARHAHGLERSLQEAGVKTDAGNMQFNLRQQPQAQTSDAGTGSNNRQAFYQPTDDAQANATNATTAAISPTITRNYTLNIRDGLDIRA